jgi:2-octaprenyl-6-methoxyphenol hydroxylase
MTNRDPSAQRSCDVLVAGAGLAGLVAALGFARAGFDVVLCGVNERTGRGRTVALLDRSVAYLDALGVWTPLASNAAPLRALRLIDDTGGLFPPRAVEFHCSEIGLEAFGWNIENHAMADVISVEIADSSAIERSVADVRAYDLSDGVIHARLTDGRTITSQLVVGADGRDSRARRAAGLEARIHRYAQCALTTLLSHRLPHRDYSTEFHTRGGPFTLVPLPASDSAPHRSSLVWVMTEHEARRRRDLDDEALSREIELMARSMLGALRTEGDRGLFPMVRYVVPRIAAERVALVGDAAHAFPPIGAQGLNLGLRDVEAIVEIARTARAEGRDIGGPDVLSEYERARQADITMRMVLVNSLNQALLTRFAPIDFLRGAGLASFGAIGPLRRFVMREAIAPRLAR